MKLTGETETCIMKCFASCRYLLGNNLKKIKLFKHRDYCLLGCNTGSLARINCAFEETCCLHLQGKNTQYVCKKMQAQFLFVALKRKDCNGRLIHR